MPSPHVRGQTGLNISVALYESGVLEKYGVQMIGAIMSHQKRRRSKSLQGIDEKDCLDLPRSGLAYSRTKPWRWAKEIGFLSFIRPSFTLGGTGVEWPTILKNSRRWRLVARVEHDRRDSHRRVCHRWKEFELEVMRELMTMSSSSVR